MQRGVQRWMGGAGQFLLQPQARGPHSAPGRRVPGAEAPGCLRLQVEPGPAHPAGGRDTSAGGKALPQRQRVRTSQQRDRFPGLECCVAPPGKFFASDWRFGGYLIVFQ